MAVWKTPMRSVCRSPLWIAATSALSVSTSPSTRRARRYTASPAGVSVIAPRPPGRMNIGASSPRSSSAIWWEIADCVYPSERAAPRNDP